MFKMPGGLIPRLIALSPLLFPLYLFRGNFMGVPVTLAEAGVGLLFLLFLLQRPRFKSYEWKLWPVFLFLFAAMMGVILAPKTSFMIDGTEFPAQIKALGILKGWILTPLVYFVMARHTFRDKPSMIPLALRSLMLSGVILSFMAFNQVLTGDFLTPDGRASGPFESANYLALYIGPLLVYSILAMIHAKRSPWDMGFLATGALVLGMALYFTDSYAAWIAVTASVAFALLLQLHQKSKKSFWLGFLALALVGGALVLSQVGTEKFTQFLEWNARSSSSVRVQVYKISLHLLKTHPLLGIGLGQFEQEYQEVAVSVLDRAPFEWNMPHPHNIFLAFWLNMGLMGLLSAVWMSVRALAWLREKDRHERNLVAFMLAALLIHGLFDTPYFKNDLSFEWWLFMAILL